MGVFKDLHVYLVEESIDDIAKVVSRHVNNNGLLYALSCTTALVPDSTSLF